MRSQTQHTTLTMHCRCKGETARKRTDHPNSYTEVKKTRSLTQHTHGCVKASLKDRSSSTLYIYMVLGQLYPDNNPPRTIISLPYKYIIVYILLYETSISEPHNPTA